MYAFFFRYEVWGEKKRRAEEIFCCEMQGLIDSVSNLAASRRFLPVIEIQPGPRFSLVSLRLMTESIWKTAAHPSARLVRLSLLFCLLPPSLSSCLGDSVHPKGGKEKIK